MAGLLSTGASDAVDAEPQRYDRAVWRNGLLAVLLTVGCVVSELVWRAGKEIVRTVNRQRLLDVKWV